MHKSWPSSWDMRLLQDARMLRFIVPSLAKGCPGRWFTRIRRLAARTRSHNSQREAKVDKCQLPQVQHERIEPLCNVARGGVECVREHQPFRATATAEAVWHTRGEGTQTIQSWRNADSVGCAPSEPRMEALSEIPENQNWEARVDAVLHLTRRGCCSGALLFHRRADGRAVA